MNIPEDQKSLADLVAEKLTEDRVPMRQALSIPLTEAEFQSQVVNLAESFGWQWMHIGRTGKHVPNGAKGTLGRGWPDLTHGPNACP